MNSNEQNEDIIGEFLSLRYEAVVRLLGDVIYRAFRFLFYHPKARERVLFLSWLVGLGILSLFPCLNGAEGLCIQSGGLLLYYSLVWLIPYERIIRSKAFKNLSTENKMKVSPYSFLKKRMLLAANIIELGTPIVFFILCLYFSFSDIPLHDNAISIMSYILSGLTGFPALYAFSRNIPSPYHYSEKEIAERIEVILMEKKDGESAQNSGP